jgi:hypothetical protein
MRSAPSALHQCTKAIYVDERNQRSLRRSSFLLCRWLRWHWPGHDSSQRFLFASQICQASLALTSDPVLLSHKSLSIENARNAIGIEIDRAFSMMPYNPCSPLPLGRKEDSMRGFKIAHRNQESSPSPSPCEGEATLRAYSQSLL